MSSPTTGDPVAEARSKEIDRALKEVSLGFHWLQSMILNGRMMSKELGYLKRRRPKAWIVKD